MNLFSCTRRRADLLAEWWRAAIFSIALCAGLSSTHAQAPVERGGHAAITSLANHLSGFDDMAMALSRLGQGAEVKSLRQRTGNNIRNLPARSVLENLVHRANSAEAGEGDRLIAALLRDAGRTSAAIANDPTLRDYVNRYPPESLNLRARPLKLAPISAIAAKSLPLAPAAAQAITKLAEHYTDLGVARLRAAALANLRKPGFDTRVFDETVLNAADPRDAILRMIDAGSPPPTTEAAVRNMMMAAAAESAAFGADQATIDLIERLAHAPMPEYERYVAVEDKFESRQAQYREANKAKQKPKVTPSADAEVQFALRSSAPAAGVPLRRSPWFSKRLDTAVAQGNLGGGAGGGGGYDRYIDRTFQAPNGDATARTSRSFSSARFSASAGRGVSVGASFRSAVPQQVKSAIWVPNEKDNRFGRLFVAWEGDANGNALVAATRLMFADSFRSAIDVLWRPSSPAARFQEGNILVVMSMDPKGPVSASRRARMRELWAQHEAAMRSEMSATEEAVFAQLRIAIKSEAPEGDEALENGIRLLGMLILLRSPERLEGFERQLEELGAERDIVLHPALVGRELGWSSARVDFWTNQPEVLGREAALLASNKPAPAVLNELPLAMSTWQYYEREGAIFIDGKGPARQLVVRSLASETHPAHFPASTRSHFSLAMFSGERAPEATPAEEGLYRRPDAERKMQPLLDWLAVSHHDYMRLNDFSESLMLLRWLKSLRVEVQLMDMAGDRPRIAAPDRVNIKTGPKVGP